MVLLPAVREKSDIIFEAWRHSEDLLPAVRKLSDVIFEAMWWRERKGLGHPVDLWRELWTGGFPIGCSVNHWREDWSEGLLVGHPVDHWRICAGPSKNSRGFSLPRAWKSHLSMLLNVVESLMQGCLTVIRSSCLMACWLSEPVYHVPHPDLFYGFGLHQVLIKEQAL